MENGRRREFSGERILLQPDRWQRYSGLHASLQLQQLDLEIGGGGEIRLFLFQPPKLGNLARL